MAGHISPKSTYYTIFGSLMVLTAITVSVAFINLGTLNFPVALSIAVLKATLVILFGLTLSDYLSRGWFVAPGGTTGAGTQVTVGPATPVEVTAQPEAAPEP